MSSLEMTAAHGRGLAANIIYPTVLEEGGLLRSRSTKRAMNTLLTSERSPLEYA